MRLHPYLTQRAVDVLPGWRAAGRSRPSTTSASTGPGTPAELRRADLAPAARVLAAADCYRTRLEPRPHREAQSVASAAAHLRHEVVAGRLDADAVEAVLGAAGHRRRRRPEGAAGLTPRELEVLRLLARGASTRVIGRRLEISPKTAANHIEHIYAKLGVGNRALASLRAERLGLVGSDDVDAVEEGGAG